MIKTMNLSDLVEDLRIYPRQKRDPSHSAGLYEALKAGAELPPMVVDAKSHRVVDGVHRLHAYLRFYGTQGAIPVQVVSYDSEADLLIDAVTRNATHGRKLETVDKTRCIRMLSEAGATTTKIAMILQVTEKKVSELSVRIAYAPGYSDTIPGTSAIPIKRGSIRFSEQTVTTAQAKAIASAPGTSYTLIAKQLREGLAHDLADRDSESLVRELLALLPVLQKWLNA